MRLLHLSPYVAHPLNHGGRQRTRMLLRAARDAGYRVVNVALARSAEEVAAAEALRAEGIDARPFLVEPTPERLDAGARLAKWSRLALGRSSLLPRFVRAAGFEAVRAACGDGAPDLVVVDSPWMDAYRAAAPPVRYVASTHNVEGDVLRDAAAGLHGPARLAARLDAALLLRFERRFVARAAFVAATSEDDARRLFALAHGARVVVVPNTVDLERLRRLPPAPKDGPFLFVGSFDYPPNVEAARVLALEWLPAMRAAVGGAEALIAGRAPGPETRALADRPGVVVRADVDDLVPLYAAARAVVVPLRAGGGSRLKLLEAFALGRPTIATKVAAAGLGIAPDVHYLAAETAAEAAAAALRLRDDAALGPRLADAARAFVDARHAPAAAARAYAAGLEAARRALP